MKNLVIVESPAKAKTIEKFLGKDFVVKSSFGHIRDLPKKGMGIDIENNFEPSYEVSIDKKKQVKELADIVKKVDQVWLATDEDREGEAIAWHLAEVLGLDPKTTKRIVFHEITKNAITAAVANPRTVNIDLVNAQQTRRILDRIVGFKLSPILWKKIRTGLSAGRVQSIAVRLIVEKERAVAEFNAADSYKVQGVLNLKNLDELVEVELSSKIKNYADALAFIQQVLAEDAADAIVLETLEQKQAKRSSKPPFITSSLQQEASTKLGYTPKKTMMLAQRLYEAGMITYMRTDSLNLSEDAIANAAAVISRDFSKKYSKPTRYKSKKSDAQEAHEAIRPTDFNTLHTSITDSDQSKVYRLIYNRTLASQMEDAVLLRTNAKIKLGSMSEVLVAKGEVIEFDGFLKVYGGDNKEQKTLPNLKEGDKFSVNELIAKQSFNRPPARYNEASLISDLEDLGIGRPSTYAPTIDTIIARNYVVKNSLEGSKREVKLIELKDGAIVEKVEDENFGADKNKLFPTDIAFIVNDFLVKNFSNITDYEFTARLEKDFDQIAIGEKTWQNELDEFYKDLLPKLTAAEGLSREQAGHTRNLGVDPVSGEPVKVKIGRYGPYIQLGDGDEENKPKFAGLNKDQNMDTINLEEAMELFKLPRLVGTMPRDISYDIIDGSKIEISKGAEIFAKSGFFGSYLEFGPKRFVSLPKEFEPLTINLEEAVVIIAEKLEKDANKILKIFAEDKNIQILNGRWGPYVTNLEEKINAKISKDLDPQSLDYNACLEILKKGGKKTGKRTFKKKTKKT